MEKKGPPSSENIRNLSAGAIGLLKQLIATPSFSKEEDKSATVIQEFLQKRGVHSKRYLNNIWAVNKAYGEGKPTIVLNSHHDTVPPNKDYTVDPFDPTQQPGKIFGLGSNDAGGALVSLVATFLYFYDQENLSYNLILALTAEEEISGSKGLEALLQENAFNKLLTSSESVCGIVGEPTLMQMAIAERGLMVLDGLARGKSGHAARDEGENAIYKAMIDIEWLHAYRFEKVSELLGPVKITVTSIETANKAHNIVPSECRFTVDIRVNELYSLEEVLQTIKQNLQSEVKARSTRLRSTSIALDHPLVKAGLDLGRDYYGSPTSSDKALMPFPALKIGPGDSARSHTADEFIFLHEIEEGIHLYIKLLDNLVL